MIRKEAGRLLTELANLRDLSTHQGGKTQHLISIYSEFIISKESVNWKARFKMLGVLLCIQPCLMHIITTTHSPSPPPYKRQSLSWCLMPAFTSWSAVALCPVTRRHMMMCSNKITWKDDKIGLQSSTGREKAVALGKNEKARALHSEREKLLMQLASPRAGSNHFGTWRHLFRNPDDMLSFTEPWARLSHPLFLLLPPPSLLFTEEMKHANKNLPQAGGGGLQDSQVAEAKKQKRKLGLRHRWSTLSNYSELTTVRTALQKGCIVRMGGRLG